MAIPIAYNLRNLTVRKTTTLMTALGIGLTVAVLVAVLALVSGLQTAFAVSGNPLQMIVLRKGSTAELNSGLTREIFQDLKFKPGIAKTETGDPMASLEMVTVINLASTSAPSGMNLTLRGVLPLGFDMRAVKISEGRMFRAGQREIVVGKSIAKRYPDAKLGGKLKFGKGYWDVVGIVDGGQSAANGEIFGDLNQIASDFNRENGLSSILVRATDRSSLQALINSLSDDRKLNVGPVLETEYYERQTSSGAPIQFLGIFISVIMAVGSSFAAMNTMYASVSRRSKEIGTLRVLGFSRGSILISFFLESLLLALMGGILGCLLVLPLNGLTTGIGSFQTFSEISFDFRVTPVVMAIGISFALLMGALGGLFPARNASRKEILTALREI